MTISKIVMNKFIVAIQTDTVPDELTTQYQKIKIDAIAAGKEVADYLNIAALRHLFSISDVTRLITYYRHITTEEQLNIIF